MQLLSQVKLLHKHRGLRYNCCFNSLFNIEDVVAFFVVIDDIDLLICSVSESLLDNSVSNNI